MDMPQVIEIANGAPVEGSFSEAEMNARLGKLREDVETVLEPGMVVSMEPMIVLPEGQPGAGGYREHDILVITEDGNRDITGFPYGPEHNIIRS